MFVVCWSFLLVCFFVYGGWFVFVWVVGVVRVCCCVVVGACSLLSFYVCFNVCVGFNVVLFLLLGCNCWL